MDINTLTGRIIGAAIEVHRALGPGLLESTYESCLAHELRSMGLRVERQVAIPIVYKGKRIEGAYRIDLRVEGAVIVEIKSAVRLERVYEAQVITYLKLSGCPVGLLINFDVPVLRTGIRRLVRGHVPRPSDSARATRATSPPERPLRPWRPETSTELAESAETPEEPEK